MRVIRYRSNLQKNCVYPRQDDAQGDTPAEVPAWMAKTPRSRTAQHERYCQAQEHLAELQVANQQYSPSELELAT